MKKLAIFASGSGSNFQAIVDAVKTGRLHAEVALLVCDNPGAFCIERAKKAGISAFVFAPKKYAAKADYETEIYEKLMDLKIDFIVLAGYMRLIGETLLTPFSGRIVNIHPSLLPSFPGKDAIGQALAAKVQETGVTIHFVDAGMDTGPIMAQQSIPISEFETRESLQARIQEIEHELYPSVLQKLLHS